MRIWARSLKTPKARSMAMVWELLYLEVQPSMSGRTHQGMGPYLAGWKSASWKIRVVYQCLSMCSAEFVNIDAVFMPQEGCISKENQTINISGGFIFHGFCTNLSESCLFSICDLWSCSSYALFHTLLQWYLAVDLSILDPFD